MKDDFYKRVKNSLPCDMNEWTDEQLISQWNKGGSKFYKSMMLLVADKRNIELREGVSHD